MKTNTGCLNYIIIVIVILLVFIAVNMVSRENFEDQTIMRFPKNLGFFPDNETITPNKLYGQWNTYTHNVPNMNCVPKQDIIEMSGPNIPYDTTIYDSLNIVTPEELLEVHNL